MAKQNEIKRLAKMVNDEYISFRDEMFSKNSRTVFESALQIYFYQEVNDFIQNGLEDTNLALVPKKIEKIIGYVKEIERGLLREMFGYYLKYEYTGISSYEEIEALINDFYYWRVKRMVK